MLSSNPNKPLLKICGTRDPQNIMDIQALNPDYMGFIFFADSKRFVGEDFVMPLIHTAILKIGVFVNEKVDKISALIGKHRLDGVQLHGDESVAFCLEIKKLNPHIKLIKALRIGEKSDLEKIVEFEDVVDLFVLDSAGALFGGNGTSWDYTFLKDKKINTPFLLSGGIDETFDVSQIKNIHQSCVGIDVNSGFETEPGIKNIEKIKTFKNANNI